MNNPLSDFHIGRMRHEELEADWTRDSGSSREGRSMRVTFMALATLLGSIATAAILVAQGVFF